MRPINVRARVKVLEVFGNFIELVLNAEVELYEFLGLLDTLFVSNGFFNVSLELFRPLRTHRGLRLNLISFCSLQVVRVHIGVIVKNTEPVEQSGLLPQYIFVLVQLHMSVAVSIH